MLIQIVQPGDDFLQHLGRGDQEHGVAHIAGEGSIFFYTLLRACHFNHLALRRKIWQMAMFHVFNRREHPLGNHIINLARIAIFEVAPTHGLPDGRRWKDFVHLLASHAFEFFRFQFFFIERTDEHQIG